MALGTQCSSIYYGKASTFFKITFPDVAFKLRDKLFFTVYLLGGSAIIRVNSVIHVSLELKLKMATFRLKLYCS